MNGSKLSIAAAEISCSHCRGQAFTPHRVCQRDRPWTSTPSPTTWVS